MDNLLFYFNFFYEKIQASYTKGVNLGSTGSGLLEGMACCLVVERVFNLLYDSMNMRVCDIEGTAKRLLRPVSLRGLLADY